MKKKLLNISNKIDRINLKILSRTKEVADKLNIDFFIVGASVRDFILNYIYNIKIYRATNDIDFAISLRNWNEYNLLSNEIEKAGFIKSENILHRYSYKGMIVDFIPFGAITNPNETIEWQDEDKKEMNVIGFEDAYRNAEEIIIQNDPEIIIKAASVESLVMLKIFAWNDRSTDQKLKDAKDLCLIATTYLEAGNRNRLFEEHSDIFNKVDDYEIGGARLLGRDISKIASAKVLQSLYEILEDAKLNALAKDMAKFEGLHLDDEDTKTEKCKEILISMLHGLKDKI
ncbi:MAG: nucleotidyl transferase AbiEii/AbiGii toxin family protein [Ignavibacteriaceae bacterium]|nr:nucleotidyl transferase AbiEii/AbiGii toxin family protein [Ignavibacteriaceae bacterium]